MKPNNFAKDLADKRWAEHMLEQSLKKADAIANINDLFKTEFDREIDKNLKEGKITSNEAILLIKLRAKDHIIEELIAIAEEFWSPMEVIEKEDRIKLCKRLMQIKNSVELF